MTTADAHDAPRTLLITLTGKDRPGVTSSIFETLARSGVEVLDIEQIVLRRRLVLGVLVSAPRDWKRLRDAVEQTAADLGMTVEQAIAAPRATQRNTASTTAEPEFITAYGPALTALGRFGTAEEVAETVTHLAGAAYVTGAEVSVDGGHAA